MQSETCGNEALSMLLRDYHKILKVNLTKDSHEDLRVVPGEITEACGYADKISDWLKGVALEGKTYVCCHYRRKINGVFRWVSMELIAAQEYRDDNQVVFL